jgi:hypothetical protein
MKLDTSASSAIFPQKIFYFTLIITGEFSLIHNHQLTLLSQLFKHVTGLMLAAIASKISVWGCFVVTAIVCFVRRFL